MNIRKMRCYFLYNIPVTEQLLSDGRNTNQYQEIGVTPQLIDRFEEHFDVRVADIPAFYTNHYRREHTPYNISDPSIPQETYIDNGRLQNIGFFQELNLSHNITVSWDFTLSLQTTGLITICVEVDETLPDKLAYRLSGLHLNPDYAVIATEPIQELWEHQPQSPPPYITLDTLAQVIRTHFFMACGLNVRRVQALRHEIQIPFTAIEVDTNCKNQKEFVKQERLNLAEFVFKPNCWEVERTSLEHARHILGEDRVWSVAEDTYVVVAYEGTLHVNIRNFNTGVQHEVSGFNLTDEASVLHSFKLAVSVYHFLRILDDLLDPEIINLKEEVDQHQQVLHDSFDNSGRTNYTVLREMNEFVIQVTDLQFRLVELLEEIDNADKLIDEEWHIVLLEKLTQALGTKIWRDGINGRVNSLRELAQTVENTYQRFLNLNANKSIADFNAQLLIANEESQKMEDRLKWVTYIFSVLALAELLGLLINIGLDDSNSLSLSIRSGLHLGNPYAHILAIILVFMVLAGAFLILLWWERYDA